MSKDWRNSQTQAAKGLGFAIPEHLLKLNHVQSLKEVTRDLFVRAGLYDVILSRRKDRGGVVSHLTEGPVQDRFRAIYQRGVWKHSDGQVSLSGVGSESAATSEVASALPGLLSELQCKTVLDVGCGDWNWMRNVALRCDYIGIDIVPEVIERNKAFEREGVRFEMLDATSGEIPRADVALCREMLFHLSLKDARKVIFRLLNAAAWIVATTDTSIWFNSEIPTGDYRMLNLQRRPFRFSPPMHMLRDDGVFEGRVLGVWKSEDLKSLMR